MSKHHLLAQQRKAVQALIAPPTVYAAADDSGWRGKSERFMGLLFIFSSFTALAVFASQIAAAPFIIENDHRLAPTFAILRGYSLYYGQSDGPILSTMYGPITALAYLPAALARTPVLETRIATILSMLLFYLPALVLLRKLEPRMLSWPWIHWARCLILITALVSLVEPLSKSSSLVHADAPALGASALSCFFALRSCFKLGPQENTILSALFAVCSVLAKQNMLPLLPVLALWWLITQGWVRCIQFTMASLIWFGLGVAATAIFLGGFEAFALNWFQIPIHQPFRKALLFPAINDLVVQGLLFLWLPLALLIRRSMNAHESLRSVFSRNPTVLLMLAGLALAATSVLGRIKAGGNVNALSPTLYFLSLACAAELAPELTSDRDRDPKQSFADTRTWLAVVLCAFALVQLPQHIYYLSRIGGTSPLEAVYNFDKVHPGLLYFPQFPLATLKAEGKLYHFSWGLTDRRIAGYPVSSEHYLRHVPRTAEAIAMVGFVPEWDVDIISRRGDEVNLPYGAELSGFRFYTLNPPPRRFRDTEHPRRITPE